MKNPLELALLFIVVLNIAVILITCMFNSAAEAKSKKKIVKNSIVLFAVNLAVDVASLIGFIVAEGGEYTPVFAFFIVMMAWFLYMAIEEAKTLR